MPDFRAEASLKRTLYNLHEVTLALDGGKRLGPITWAVPRGRRVAVSCGAEGQWAALEALLSGQREPLSGVMEEADTVTVQTDANLLELIDLNRSIGEFLHSPDAPEFAWLENRRRSLWVLIDLLGISASMTRRPLKMEPAEVRDKYWALRFMLSRADLLMGREIFHLADPDVQGAFVKRWSDFPGTVIVCEDHVTLPGPVDARVRIDADGNFAVTAVESGAPPEQGVGSA